jgi:ribosomal protein S18 acetylase RimI-like enzyme
MRSRDIVFTLRLRCNCMLLRPATPDDVPQVLPMVAKICALHESWDRAKYGFREKVSEMYRGWLTSRAKDPHSIFLVAAREGGAPAEPRLSQERGSAGASPSQASALVAFLVATLEREIPIYRLEQFGFIHDLWVEPEYRHEGIARQMTMLAIERFREMGVRQIRLDTAEENDATRALFASCGFRQSTREMLLEL